MTTEEEPLFKVKYKHIGGWVDPLTVEYLAKGATWKWRLKVWIRDVKWWWRDVLGCLFQ